MDTCDGNYDKHEWVAYNNDTTCPVCTMRDELNEANDKKQEEIESLEELLKGAVNANDELEEKLSEYADINEGIKKMVEERL